MFLHSFKYSFKSIIRNKMLVFWSLLFTVILATFFKIAFSGIAQAEFMFNKIDVAVIYNKNDAVFAQLVDQLCEEDVLSLHDADESEADDLLKDGELACVIYVDDEISLTTATSSSYQVDIVKSIIDAYTMQSSVIMQIAKENPLAVGKAVEQLSADISGAISEKKLSDGNMDPFLQYFFNVLAMGTLMGVHFGLIIALSTQGNLSPIAARKCVSPVNKSVSALAGIAAAVIVQFIISCITIVYLLFVLDVDMGDKTAMIFLTVLVGSVLAVSVGYAVGSVGTMSENMKSSILTMLVTFGGFLTGLMVSDMKITVMEKAPIVHKINPASLLTDAFYSLAMCDGYDRYMKNIVTMLVLSVVAIVAGIIMTRRQRYASL